MPNGLTGPLRISKSLPPPANLSPPIFNLSLTASSEISPQPQHPSLCETDAAAELAVKANDERRGSTQSVAASGKGMDKTSWNYVLRSGFAGGIAGCVAKTAIAPLDRVKILFQAQNPEFQKYSGRWLGVFTAARDIVQTQGPFALFQGHSATLIRIFPYAAIKYMAYDKLHFYLMPTKEMETGARLFMAGSMSGVLSVFLTYPLELIRVRLAFETKRKKQAGSLKAIIRKIYFEGSTEAPFSGDARRRATRGAPTSSPAAAATGQPNGIANLSTSAVQIQAIKNGADSTSPVPQAAPSAATETTNKLLKKLPILKFYRGFSVTVMGMIPYAGTSFLVFGRCKTLLQGMFPPSEGAIGSEGSRRRWYWPSKTVVDLSAGALAGAISQTAAYPFEVIRRRQQVGGIIRPGSMLGMGETALWIWRTSGLKGFYVGLSIGFLKVVPMTSISFAVWLHMKRQMGI
ncbi:putative LEU5-mitochondrial coenzyme A transporter-member of the mitochondrial carrier family [Violaceomyces palustris]|uniref:LEU5-mitochondrial coenzyme A transporter-member of the mitochondrial carrier family n=1 Tax=Violaceomyces palustris TaxID=1673888 RepID=A0ACD0P3Z5_9BASI|nr:putative LEU5-mitochondrial coenzyme A transporter-member of the mitochondrial carrier family [Violaceomyces palustris]